VQERIGRLLDERRLDGAERRQPALRHDEVGLSHRQHLAVHRDAAGDRLAIDGAEEVLVEELSRNEERLAGVEDADELVDVDAEGHVQRIAAARTASEAAELVALDRTRLDFLAVLESRRQVVGDLPAGGAEGARRDRGKFPLRAGPHVVIHERVDRRL